ncbi:hypothetical protein D3C80_1368430 [compost metagenome]
MDSFFYANNLHQNFLDALLIVCAIDPLLFYSVNHLSFYKFQKVFFQNLSDPNCIYRVHNRLECCHLYLLIVQHKKVRNPNISDFWYNRTISDWQEPPSHLYNSIWDI